MWLQKSPSSRRVRHKAKKGDRDHFHHLEMWHLSRQNIFLQVTEVQQNANSQRLLHSVRWSQSLRWQIQQMNSWSTYLFRVEACKSLKQILPHFLRWRIILLQSWLLQVSSSNWRTQSKRRSTQEERQLTWAVFTRRSLSRSKCLVLDSPLQ